MKDIPPKITSHFSTTTRNFGNLTPSVDRADEIKPIDSVQAIKNFLQPTNKRSKNRVPTVPIVGIPHYRYSTSKIRSMLGRADS